MQESDEVQGQKVSLKRLEISGCKQLKYLSLDYHIGCGPGLTGNPEVAYSKITKVDLVATQTCVR